MFTRHPRHTSSSRQCLLPNVSHSQAQHHLRKGCADPSVASYCNRRLRRTRHCQVVPRPPPKRTERANDRKAQNQMRSLSTRPPCAITPAPPPQKRQQKNERTLLKLVQQASKSALTSGSLWGQYPIFIRSNIISNYLPRVCSIGCYKVPQQRFCLIEEDLTIVTEDRWFNTALVDFTVA